MKKILILTLFLSANVFAGYDIWYKYSENGEWIKGMSFSDYGSCQNALWQYSAYIAKCMPN